MVMAKKDKISTLFQNEEVINNILREKNVPILILDQKWLSLFPEKKKTAQIKKLEEELKELLKRQGKVNADLKNMKKVRDKITQDVLDSVDDSHISEKERQKRQDTNKRLIMEAKEKMEELEDEALDIPRLIKQANIALAMESVSVCFERINKNQEDIEILGEWIEQTREKLKKRIIIKQDKESANEEMYTYLHDILGASAMQAFDEGVAEEN